ncbi:hypothetical protein KRR40_08105 [Niabella defluvii]|nr:hypothetical protein KRR40_08105 [Niabella sp. I65]
MKKYIIGIIFFTLGATVCRAQTNFTRTIKEYYRVNPFQGNFSSFIKALTSDPSLLKKEIYRQTDTTGYFVRGQYEVFNPYSINANKVDMLFMKMFTRLKAGFFLRFILIS